MSEPTSNAQGRLVSHFTSKSRDAQSKGWSELWDSNESAFWDRGKPSSALIHFVESRPEVMRHPQNGRRLQVLVPGCGKGFDVVMLALHGFDVYGLEVSEKAAEVARAYAAAEMADPSESNFGNEEEWPATAEPGKVRILVGDFFKRNWEEWCSSDKFNGFDLIYDYTFLCALLPEMRNDWARRMSELLAPSGALVCLEFPLFKDLKDLGPPWGLKGAYWNLLAQGGDGIVDGSGEETQSAKGSFRRLLYFKPAVSFENGKGTDMMSVWTLK